MENLSCVLVRPLELEFRNIPIDEPAENHIQIAVHSNGICASDVHKWESGRLGTFEITEPLVLGHECSGTVIKIGKNVTNLNIGDRVALEGGIACKYCDFCKRGKSNLCHVFTAISLPGCQGSLSNYFNHPADYSFKLPNNVSLEEGALVEPLAIALHAIRRVKMSIGSRVLITGAGTIGNMALLLCKAMGARHIVITDIDEDKLKFAGRMGADRMILANRNNKELAEKINEYTEIDVSLECSGVNAGFDLGIQATRAGGIVCMVGILPPETATSSHEILRKELDILGSFAYVNCYPMAIDLISRGVVNVKPLVTHRYKLTEAVKAFERARSGYGKPLKIMIKSEKCMEN